MSVCDFTADSFYLLFEIFRFHRIDFFENRTIAFFIFTLLKCNLAIYILKLFDFLESIFFKTERF